VILPRSHGHPLARTVAWALLDALTWVLAVYGATWMRYQFDYHVTLRTHVVWIAVVAAAAQLVVGLIFGVYSRSTVRGSFEELEGISTTVAVVTLGIVAWMIVAHNAVVPRTIPIVAGLLAFAAVLAARSVVRSVMIRRMASRSAGKPIVVFGAGAAGRLLVRNLRHDDNSPYQPIGFFDDDKSKRRFQVDGVKVLGTRDDLEKVMHKLGISDLVIAIPSASSSTIRELRALAEEAGLHPMVVPPLSQLVGHNPSAADIREIHLEDLLSRRPVQLDETALAESLSHRRVLVTGAGGSIGSELCRQIAKYGPEMLIVLDRDESALHSLQISLEGHGLLSTDAIVLADIRDPTALRRIFLDRRPEIVFHAAALKHLPLLERYPLEGWQTNVLGTLNVLRAAAAAGVDTFVNISTDKAAEPTSVLGYTKRIAERLTAQFAAAEKGRYLSVRFGNVLGSRGSVIPTFTAQIRRGGPLTVTHPEVQRYFMLIPEACQLVIQASVIGSDGEVMVLEMGEQVKIVDVAKTLIEMSGRTDIDIVFTGLRPGEKLAEALFDSAASERPTSHPLVNAVDVSPLEAAEVERVEPAPETAVALMTRLSGRAPAPPPGSPRPSPGVDPRTEISTTGGQA
jgi:FlaA1/EpsC-like NDP-sugar epimerase